jgi:hypothetical protein
MSLFDHPAVAGKVCSVCKMWKPLGAFHRKTKSRDGRQSRCKPCNIAGQIRVHAENPELCRQRISRRHRRVVDELRGLLFEYLCNHPCVDSGERDPVVMEFDHVRGTKVANVSALVFGLKRWSTILEEIAKCDVVCANCHRRRTAQRADSFRLRMMRRQSNP